METRRTLDLMAKRRSRGPESMRSKSTHVRKKRNEVKPIYALPFATWKRQECPIFVEAKTVRSPSDGTEGIARWTLRIFRSNLHRDLHRWTVGGGLSSRSRSDGHGEARSAPLREDTWSIGCQSDGADVSWKNSTIAVRLNRDHGAIEPRSWSVHRGIASMGSDSDRWRIKTTIDARLWPDCVAIVAPLRQKSWLIHRLIGSHVVAK